MLLLLTGCALLGQECDLMYVSNAMTVAFEVVEEGEWSWSVSGEGVDVACSVTLPGGEDAACDDGLTFPSVTETDEGWTIGSTTDSGGQDELHVVLLHGDVVVLDTVVQPDWTIDEPNGKGCGEHFTWSETWTIE